MKSQWSNVFRQLANNPQDARSDRQPVNPRPPGVIRHGSATHAVLAVFQEKDGQWLSHRNVRWLARLDGRQADWALHYLRKIGLIEQFVGDEGNPRSAKYRLISGPQQSPVKVSGQMLVLGSSEMASASPEKPD